LFVVIWCIALVQLSAEYFYWYWTYKWFDIPMHFLSGLWVGLAALYLSFHTTYLSEQVRRVAPFLLAIGAGLLVGLVWEGYEYLVWVYTDTLPPNHRPDSLLDLVMDVLGAGIGWLVYERCFRGREKHG
jgi:hypothetical protein